MMEDHKTIMRTLLEYRENRAYKIEVGRLKLDELVEWLKIRNCSTAGSVIDLRDRLIRALIRENPAMREFVPWYDADNAAEDEQVPATASSPMALRIEVPQQTTIESTISENRRVEREQYSSQASTTSEEDASRPRVLTVNAMMHAPEVRVPVSAATTTSTVTSVITGVSTSTMASTIGGRPYQSNPIGTPGVALNLNLAYLRQLPGQWEYFQAERVRGVSANLPPPAGQMQPLVEYLPPLQPNIIPPPVQFSVPVSTPQDNQRTKIELNRSQQYFTPRQNFDEILPASPDRNTDRENSEEQIDEDELDRTRERLRAENERLRAKRARMEACNKTPARPMDSRPPLRENLRRIQFDQEPLRRYSNSPPTQHREEVPMITEHRRYSAPEFTRSYRNEPREIYTDDTDRFSDRGSINYRNNRDNFNDRGENNYRINRVNRFAENDVPRDRRQNFARNSDRENSPIRRERVHERARYPEKRETPRRRDRDFSTDSEREDDCNYSSRRREDRHRGEWRDSREHAQRNSRGSESKNLQTEAVKLLKSWSIRFSGEDRNEDPEEFLERLEDFRRSAEASDHDVLNALPCILTKRAGRWFRTERDSLRDWFDFCHAFRRQYIGEYDEYDLLEDLRKRTQGKEEKISSYLADLKYIISRFDRPPSKRQQVETAWRNLLPEYRGAMADKRIDSFEVMERYGRRWEKQKDLDKRYVPPPPANKMRVPGAAYRGMSGKVAATAVETRENNVAAATESTESTGKKKKGKNGENCTAAVSSAQI